MNGSLTLLVVDCASLEDEFEFVVLVGDQRMRPDFGDERPKERKRDVNQVYRGI